MKISALLSSVIVCSLLFVAQTQANPLYGKWFKFYDLKKEDVKYGYEIAEFKEEIYFFYKSQSEWIRSIYYKNTGDGLAVRFGKNKNWEKIKFIDRNAFVWGNDLYTRFIPHKTPPSIFLTSTKLQIHYYRQKVIRDIQRSFYHVPLYYPQLVHDLKLKMSDDDIDFAMTLSIFDSVHFKNHSERLKFEQQILNEDKLFNNIDYFFENEAVLDNVEVLEQSDKLWILKFLQSGATFYLPVSLANKHQLSQLIYYFPTKSLESAKKQLGIIKEYLVAKKIY